MAGEVRRPTGRPADLYPGAKAKNQALAGSATAHHRRAARPGVLAGVRRPDHAEGQAALLTRSGLPSSYAGVAPEAVLEAMTHDKKMAAGTLRWVLLEAAGRAAVHGDVPSADVERIVRELAE